MLELWVPNDIVETEKRFATFAKDTHDGQMYGDKSYFDGHLKLVAEKAKELFPNYPNVFLTAYFHDLFEHPGASLPLVYARGKAEFTYEWMCDNTNVSEIVLQAVRLLTKEKGTDYQDYIRQLRYKFSVSTSVNLARAVKYCDLICNFEAKGKPNKNLFMLGLLVIFLPTARLFQNIRKVIQNERYLGN